MRAINATSLKLSLSVKKPLMHNNSERYKDGYLDAIKEFCHLIEMAKELGRGPNHAKIVDADSLQEMLKKKDWNTGTIAYTKGYNDALLVFKSMIHGANTVENYT